MGETVSRADLLAGIGLSIRSASTKVLRGIYFAPSPMLKKPLDESIEELRQAGHVPIGVISMDMNSPEGKEFQVHLFRDVNPQEAMALLEKLNLKVSFR